MANSAGDGASSPQDLTSAVATARRGLRGDVSVLVRALERGEFLAPLAAKIAGATYGQQFEIEGELKLCPHMLEDSDGKIYCALFTRADMMEPLEEQLGWTTAGEPLEYCVIPAFAALEMTLDVMNDPDVLGLVINALDETELVLRRSEVASIAQGQAIPLVGYIDQIPEQAAEKTLLAEPADPPPPELIIALERTIAELEEIESYTLRRTFNAERDLEPHLTLTLRTHCGVDRDRLARSITSAIDGKLPDPGYIDVLFEPI